MSADIEGLARERAALGGKPDAVRINPGHITNNARLIAERQARLDALGPRPPWWRLLAGGRWRRTHARVMAMDVSQYAETLRSWYGEEQIKAMAGRKAPTFASPRMTDGEYAEHADGRRAYVAPTGAVGSFETADRRSAEQERIMATAEHLRRSASALAGREVSPYEDCAEIVLEHRRSAIFDRPPREDYVRVTVEHHGFTLEPAVEWRDGDDFDDLASKLEAIARDPWRPRGDGMLHAAHVARVISCTWPGRAYFVEVWQDGKRGFAQVVQPFGFPRNR